MLVALSGPLVPRLRSSAVAGAFLDGVNAASLALMAVVACQLARTAIVDVPSAVLAAVGGGFLLAGRVGSTWLILAAGVAGVLLRASGLAP